VATLSVLYFGKEKSSILSPALKEKTGFTAVRIPE